MDWGLLQQTCIVRNKERYINVEFANSSTMFRFPVQSDIDNVDAVLHFPDEARRIKSRPEKRTAVVYQVRSASEWTIDTLQYLRSLVMELNLHTGGEFELIVMVAAGDGEGPIFDVNEAYAQVLEESVPKELRRLSILFNTVLLKSWYPKATRNQ